MISVQPDLPVKSVKDLIALARKQPGKLQYASAGVGSFMHLGPELFKQMAKVDILHVPFRGGGTGADRRDRAATPTCRSPRCPRPSRISAPASCARSASAASRRNALIPDVPTIDESGLPGYEFANWIGIVAPAGTPPAIVARLHKELTAIQDSPELKKQFAHEGAEVVRMSSAEYGKFIASETAKWGRVVKEAGIKPQ